MQISRRFWYSVEWWRRALLCFYPCVKHQKYHHDAPVRKKIQSIISHAERGFLGNFISTQKCLHSCVQMRLSKRNHVCIMSRMCSYKSDPSGISSLFHMLKMLCSNHPFCVEWQGGNPWFYFERDVFAHRTCDIFNLHEDSIFFSPDTKIMIRIGLSKYFRCPVNCACYEQLRAEWLVVGMCVLWPQTVASPIALARILSWNSILIVLGMSKIRKFKS